MSYLSDGIDDDMGIAVIPKKDKRWVEQQKKEVLGAVSGVKTALIITGVIIGGSVLFAAARKRKH